MAVHPSFKGSVLPNMVPLHEGNRRERPARLRRLAHRRGVHGCIPTDRRRVHPIHPHRARRSSRSSSTRRRAVPISPGPRGKCSRDIAACGTPQLGVRRWPLCRLITTGSVPLMSTPTFARSLATRRRVSSTTPHVRCLSTCHHPEAQRRVRADRAIKDRRRVGQMMRMIEATGEPSRLQFHDGWEPCSCDADDRRRRRHERDSAVAPE